MGALLTSDLGREILADVLNAAADVLRQNREFGQQAQEAGRVMVETGLASTAAKVGAQATSGALDAGAEITAAAVDIAQTAAGTLATVATNAVLNMLPGSSENDERGGERRSRKGRSEGADSR